MRHSEHQDQQIIPDVFAKTARVAARGQNSADEARKTDTERHIGRARGDKDDSEGTAEGIMVSVDGELAS